MYPFRFPSGALGLALLAACTLHSEHAQFDELVAALQWMQQQTTDDFVIVEIPGTENYFQFSAEGEGFIFDVPMISLSEIQAARAREFFSIQGVEVVSASSTNPETNQTFRLETFQREFEDSELTAAATLGLGFMSEVLDHDGEISIILGWQ